MSKNRETIIIILFVVLLAVVYLEARKNAPKKIIANTQDATPGFDGYTLAKELSDAFSSGWLGNFSRKVDVLKRLNGLTLGNLKVVYNSFNENFSRKYDGKTMKTVIAEEWLYNPTYFGKDYQGALVEKFNGLNLP